MSHTLVVEITELIDKIIALDKSGRSAFQRGEIIDRYLPARLRHQDGELEPDLRRILSFIETKYELIFSSSRAKSIQAREALRDIAAELQELIALYDDPGDTVNPGNVNFFPGSDGRVIRGTRSLGG